MNRFKLSIASVATTYKAVMCGVCDRIVEASYTGQDISKWLVQHIKRTKAHKQIDGKVSQFHPQYVSSNQKSSGECSSRHKLTHTIPPWSKRAYLNLAKLLREHTAARRWAGVTGAIIGLTNVYLYLIASRSPPSQDPKLLSFFRICPLPGTHFYYFGMPFGVTFASLGPLLEHFGCIF